MEDKGPGTVISPGGVQPPSPAPAPVPQPSSPESPLVRVAPQAQQQVPLPPQPESQPQHPEPTLSWTAAEYLQHDKPAGWFVLALLGSIALSVVVFFTTKDLVSAVIVFVALLGLVVFASRKPQVQDYAVEGADIQVGGKRYHLGDFKAFSVAEYGDIVEVSMVPLRRFMPMITIRVDDAQADDLVDHLAAYLPMEQRKPDAMDGLLRRLRF